MAFLTLEDFVGTLNVTLFPNLFYETRRIILPEEIVVIGGRVDTSGETIQILAEFVTAAEFYLPDIWLTLPAELDNPATLDGLKKIFDEHAGLNKVFLNRRGKWTKLQKKISDSSEIRGELQTLLGAKNIFFY